MSKIDYQALREAAEAIKVVATPQKLLAFRMKVTPQVVLALLDERERNQQYIKRRDQENEDIALTVGKLRVELEAAEKQILKLEKLAESESVGADKAAASCVEWMKRCHDAEKRIAEMETLEVKLPEVEKWRSTEAVRAQNAYRVLVGQELSAAGIRIKGE